MKKVLNHFQLKIIKEYFKVLFNYKSWFFSCRNDQFKILDKKRILTLNQYFGLFCLYLGSEPCDFSRVFLGRLTYLKFPFFRTENHLKKINRNKKVIKNLNFISDSITSQSFYPAGWYYLGARSSLCAAAVYFFVKNLCDRRHEKLICQLEAMRGTDSLGYVRELELIYLLV